MDVGLLQRSAAQTSSIDAGGQKFQQRIQNGRSNAIVGRLVEQIDGKDQVQIVVSARFGSQNVRSSTSVQTNVTHFDRRLGTFQLVADDFDQGFQLDVQSGKVSTSVDGHDLFHYLMQSMHLVVRQHLLCLTSIEAAVAMLVTVVGGVDAVVDSVAGVGDNGRRYGQRAGVGQRWNSLTVTAVDDGLR